ncbi:MAG TPA: hypothetical protein VIG37_19865 [Methylomirabilota bacterium]
MASLLLAVPLFAQNPPPALSPAERRAAFEQGVQLRQASRYPEALSALLKAGKAGDRRAAAFVAVALEEGLGTPVDLENAARWHLIAATGYLTPNVPIQIERLRDGAIRYHVKPNHQRVTVRADGGWTRELLQERVVVKNGGDGLEGRDSVAYVVTEESGGAVTVTDWRGGWWGLSAASPEDRLTRDERTGDVTFVDDVQRMVTIRQDGRRTIAAQTGKRRRLELDAGGRLVGIYAADGKATNRYQHDYRGMDDPVMTRFDSSKGLWGMTPLPGGGQRWTLLNGDDPSKVVTMDVGIRLNRANSVVIQDRQVRRIEADDGTVVDENRRQDAGGVWITEKKVGSGGKTAYSLVTHERGTVLKQELRSNAGHFVRGGDGKDFGAASWWEVDAAGQRKPGKAWAGDIFIDDDGAIIKQGYVSEPDPDRPGDVRARRDGRGARVVEVVTSIFTSGESEQRFGHGGLVRRDLAGEVLWTVTPGGETTRYYYRGEGEAKVLVGMREGANPRWTWVDHWASRAPSRDNFATASSITTSVYRRSGDAQWQDAERKASTTYHVDGSREHVTGTGTLQRIVELDAQGRPTRFVTPETPEFRLYYATDGRLERVDHASPPGFSIVDTAYQAPPGLPLTAKEVRRGTRLEFLGWGNDRHVSFLDAKGRRVDFWGRATVVEHDGEAGAPLVYLNFRDYFTIVKRGAPTPSGRITVAERIDGLSGAGWDQSVAYSDAQGRRWQRFASGALSEFDGTGRLVRHTDERNRVFELAYAGDGSLQSAATPDRRLRRDSLSGGILDFQLTKDATLVLTLESGLEMYAFPGGRRVTLGGEGTLSRYDHRDRLSTQDHLDGGRVLLTYDSETASSATRKELAGNKRPREGTASLDVALDQGRLRTLERSVTGRDGKTTRTVVARRDGREWVDEERVRYAAAWIGGNPRQVFLATGDGRYMRVIHDDGGETRVGYDEQYERRFRVTRNAWGEVTDVQHADGWITRFTRDGTGGITVIQQGSDIVVRNSKETPATFGPSTSRQSKWAVSLLVDARGAQTWSGTNGIRRTVSPDGRIEISRPDGSRASFSPDGTRRHIFASRPGAVLAEVTEHANGDLEWIFADGAVGRHAAGSAVTEALKKDRTPEVDGQGRPRRARGYAAVSLRGDLTLLDLDRPALVVHHADGRVTELESVRGADLATSWGAIQERLSALGAATPGVSSRHLDLVRTEGANRDRLTLGMFEYEPSPIERPRPPAPPLTPPNRERVIGSVVLSADGTPQIGYASAGRAR